MFANTGAELPEDSLRKSKGEMSHAPDKHPEPEASRCLTWRSRGRHQGEARRDARPWLPRAAIRHHDTAWSQTP